MNQLGSGVAAEEEKYTSILSVLYNVSFPSIIFERIKSNVHCLRSVYRCSAFLTTRCAVGLSAGAGAPEGDPGQRPAAGEEQLDQQGLHLAADLLWCRWRRAPRCEHTHTRWRPLWVEREEAIVASQGEQGERVTA